MHTRALFLALLTLSLNAAGCGDDDSPADSGTPDGDVPDGGDGGEDAAEDAALVAICDEPAEVLCIDESFAMLNLFDNVSDAAITDESEEDGEFRHLIDTTGGAGGSAGGLTPTESFVYARFTTEGLEKVEISDDDAFQSMDWDIALRRFVVRLNSGVSGPSCVTGARTAPSTEFDSLAEVPGDLSYRTEEYFTPETCEYVSDSGIGSPATALSSFWSYSECVEMTGNVYVIELRDGHHVKFEVLSYYETEQQEACNDTGQVPMPSGAGNFRIRWAFLD